MTCSSNQTFYFHRTINLWLGHRLEETLHEQRRKFRILMMLSAILTGLFEVTNLKYSKIKGGTEPSNSENILKLTLLKHFLLKILDRKSVV